MRRALFVALASAAALAAGAAPRVASAAGAVTSATAGVSKLVSQSGMIIFTPVVKMKRDDASVPAATGFPSFDHAVGTHSDDPGGPSVTGAGNINQPNVVIGPMTADSAVEQHSDVSVSADTVVVQSTALADCRKTNVVHNCCFAPIASGSTDFTLTVAIAQRCRYQVTATLSGAADDGLGGAFANIRLTGPGVDGASEGIDSTFVGNGQSASQRSFSRSGVFDAGTVQLALSLDCDLGIITQTTARGGFGSHVRASWSVSFSLSPDAPGNDFRWTSGTGAFATDTNWLPQQAPTGSSDNAIFDRVGNYAVDFAPSARTSNSARILQGTVTFANADYRVDELSPATPSLVVDTGRLVLSNSVLTSNAAVIGDLHGVGAEVVLADANSRWDCLGQLRIGGSAGSGGEGRLTISGGADVTSVDTRIGAGAAQEGQAKVTGAGSTWNTGNVLVGWSTDGVLEIRDGASVTSGVARVGRSLGGFPQALVSGVSSDGTSSRWEASLLQLTGTGLVACADGARIGATDLDVFGGILVCGGVDAAHAQASLLSCNEIAVARDGSLSVVAGGEVEVAVGSLSVGSVTSGTGTVYVDGTDAPVGHDSSLHVDGQVVVGLDPGAGSVNVVHGGRLTSGAVFVGTDARNVGFVLVDGAGSSWAVSGDLQVGGVAADAPGSAGLVVMNGGSISATQAVCVEETGSLLGNGTIVASTFLVNGVAAPGIVRQTAPPAPPKRPVALRAKAKTPPGGTLTIEGDLVVGPTGVVLAEAAGVQPDRLVVHGAATLDGRLVLQFKNGFAPKKGAAFQVFSASGAVTGAFASVETRGLAPGAQFDVTTTAGAFTATAAADTVALPTVSVKTSAKKLLEKKAKKTKATLTFTRKGSTAEPLTVEYTVRGTASNGFDCVALPGTAKFAAKKKTVKVTVQLVDDPYREQAETLDVAVVPGADYTQSLASTARIAIVDND